MQQRDEKKDIGKTTQPAAIGEEKPIKFFTWCAKHRGALGLAAFCFMLAGFVVIGFSFIYIFVAGTNDLLGNHGWVHRESDTTFFIGLTLLMFFSSFLSFILFLLSFWQKISNPIVKKIKYLQSLKLSKNR